MAIQAQLLRRFHEDRTINPDLERFMAKRMGAKTIEVKASHLSLISHPEEITRLIFEAAGQQADAASLGKTRRPMSPFGQGGAFQWVQIPPGDRSSRKQPEQLWR